MSPVAAYFIQSMVTVLAIVALAVLILYGGRRLGLGRPSGPLELLGRLPLEARRAVYLVRVGKVVYVVGASEGGLTRLGELDAEGVPHAGRDVAAPTFAEVLGRFARPGQGGSSSAGSESSSSGSPKGGP